VAAWQNEAGIPTSAIARIIQQRQHQKGLSTKSTKRARSRYVATGLNEVGIPTFEIARIIQQRRALCSIGFEPIVCSRE
jgi:hypothetical protein